MSQTDNMLGRTIGGRYQIQELLGRGGMAEVYKAHQPSLDRFVAMKVMHSFLAEESDFFERFAREAKNVAALKHPNVIQIHDFDQVGSMTYMVMEYIEGGTLKDRITQLTKSREMMPLAEALRIVKDVGAALAYAHQRNMIHRDIKPANVMLDPGGRAVLTDFGISKIISSGKFTASGSILGTPAYMSPEQGLGQAGDHRSDIYSLGVMLYQLVTGRLPYDADTPVGVILKHVNEQLPAPRSLNPNIPVGLENVIVKALAKDPAQRFQSVKDMLEGLNNLSAAENIVLPDESTVRLPSDRTTVVRNDRTQVQAGPAAKVSQATHILTPLPVEQKRNWTPILLGALALVGAVGIVGALAVGGAMIIGQPSPTAIAATTNTPPPTATASQLAGTPTQDVVLLALTNQAATSQAQAATIQALQATDTLTPTPDLSATAAACPLAYELAKQEPTNGATLFTNRDTQVTLTFLNSGACAWDDGTLFVFSDGDDIQAEDSIAIGALAAGASVDVVLTLRPTAAKTIAANWVIALGDGRQVGEAVALSFRAAVSPTSAPTATRAPALPTATFTAAVPPTASGNPLRDVSLTFFKCDYVSGTTDYQCQVSVNIDGGVPPWTVQINGGGDLQATWGPNDARIWNTMRGRRCLAITMNITVVDATGATVTRPSFFDPQTFKIFPNDYASPCTG